MKYLSVCIPTYEMHGLGAKFLEESFLILEKQTYKDFNIIISDHSQNEEIKKLCERYSASLDIKYIKNESDRGNSSANLNNCIRNATGKIIKILFQDDFLFDEKSLEKTVKNFDLEKDHWLVSACEHSKDGKNFIRPFYPKYNHKIHLGKNTLSSPSVLTIKNDSPLLFDEKLIWLMDCNYYRRLYDKYDLPKILKEITIVNRIGNHQITKTLATARIKRLEKRYMIEKFGKNKKTLLLPQVTLVSAGSVKIPETIKALKKSMQGIKYADVIFFTHEKLSLEKDGIRVINIPRLDYPGYNKFVAYEMTKYINTEFTLVVQNDGYVLRPEKWEEEFLNYDYIGAPWPPNVHFTNKGVNVRVGNGGFSLRSKKLLNILNELNLPFTDNGTGYIHEDGLLCNYYRHELEDAGIKFAPVDVASKFSHEVDCKDSVWKPFGFHGSKLVLPRIFWPVKKVLRKLGWRI